MFIILFILVWGIPLLKEEMENQSYRESCRRRGDKTYWSTDGLRYTSNNQKVYKQESEDKNMAGALLFIGIIWLVYHLVEEASWNTNAYDGKEYDVNKAFNDACVKRISKSEFKRNYRNGKYVK